MKVVNHLLHIAAGVAIRLWPPLTAKRRLDAIGSLFEPIDVAEAIRLSNRLRGGTCLTRALVIAARLPGSEVIVGVTRVPGSPIFAHAWVESHGLRIGQAVQTELARVK